MGTKTLQVMTDDIDGKHIFEGEGRTIVLAVDGESVAVDLTNEHLAELQKALEPYFTAGSKGHAGPAVHAPAQRRTVPGPVPSNQAPAQSQPAQSGTITDKAGMTAIRDWAVANGHKVSARGRIPYSIMDAYTKAHLSAR